MMLCLLNLQFLIRTVACQILTLSISGENCNWLFWVSVLDMTLGGTVVQTILNTTQEPRLLSWTRQLRFMSLIRISSTLWKWTLCSTGHGITSETILSKISFRLLFVDKFLICSSKSCCKVFAFFNEDIFCYCSKVNDGGSIWSQSLYPASVKSDRSSSSSVSEPLSCKVSCKVTFTVLRITVHLQIKFNFENKHWVLQSVNKLCIDLIMRTHVNKIVKFEAPHFHFRQVSHWRWQLRLIE